ncbi:MAG: transporter substrate-binding domain-containing protein [Pseudomonadota bacterium]
MRKAIGLGLGMALFGGAAAACPTNYTIQKKDTLLSIAQEILGDRSQWSAIFYENEAALGGSLVDLPTGTQITIPCVDGVEHAVTTQTAPVVEEETVQEEVATIEPEPQDVTPTIAAVADPTPLQKDGADIRLLTGSNYAPFTQADWVGGGMFTELVNAAFESAPSPLPFSITWEDDWSKHLFPLLDDKSFDMGFPWIRPNCEANRTNERCANFHFSEPVFTMKQLLYVAADSTVTFAQDNDILGRTLCRPKGYFTHDLDENGRNWVAENKIKLVRPETPAECFELLLQGKADYVSANEFLGASTVAENDLEGKVRSLDRALSTIGLHVVISKRHWRGTTNLYRFNAGLAALKETPRYQAILDKHWQIFNDRLN